MNRSFKKVYKTQERMSRKEKEPEYEILDFPSGKKYIESFFLHSTLAK